MAYIKSRLEIINDEGSFESVVSEQEVKNDTNNDDATVKPDKSKTSNISVHSNTKEIPSRPQSPQQTKSAIPRLQSRNTFHSRSFISPERSGSRESPIRSKSFEHDSAKTTTENDNVPKLVEEKNILNEDKNIEENNEVVNNLCLKKDMSDNKMRISSAQSTRTIIESKENLLEIGAAPIEPIKPTTSLPNSKIHKPLSREGTKIIFKCSSESLEKRKKAQPLKKAAVYRPSKISTKSESKSSIESDKSRISMKNSQRLSIIKITDQQNLEKQFRIKKQRLETLKKDLGEKQKPLLSLYQDLLGLKNQIHEQTGKQLELDDVKFIVTKELFKPTQLDVRMAEPKVDIIKQHLNEFKNPLVTFCEHVIKKRTEIVEWLIKEPISKSVILSRQLESHRKESDVLGKDFSKMLDEIESKNQEIVNEWKLLCERVTISDDSFIHALQVNSDKQENKLKAVTLELSKANSQKQDLEKRSIEQNKTIEDLKKKLELQNNEFEEKEKKLKAQIRDARVVGGRQRVHDLETRNKELEQELEYQNSRKLEEQRQIIDNSKEAITKLQSLKEAELQRLQEEKNSAELRIKSLEYDLNDIRKNLQADIKRLEQRCFDLEKELTESEAEKDRNLKKYMAIRDRLVKMEIKAQQAADATKKRQLVGNQYHQGETPTQNEQDLWTELQATRVALRTAEEKLIKKQEEKARFMETIERAIADKDTITSEGWTARLLQKDEEIEKLQRKVEKLSDTIIYSQDLAGRQEKKINELRKTLESLMENDSAATGDRKDVLLLECREKLEHTIKRNAELEQKLVVKERALSKAENRLRDQENLLRVRDGVIGIMKSKKDVTVTEYDNLKEYVGDLMHQYNEINSKLTQKTEELDQLYTNLECKTIQIDRLEKTVKSLEQLCKEATSRNADLQDKIRNYQKFLQEASTKTEPHTPGYAKKKSNFSLTNSEYTNTLVNVFSQDTKIFIKPKSSTSINDSEFSSSQQEFIKCAKVLECSNHLITTPDSVKSNRKLENSHIKEYRPISLEHLKHAQHDFIKTDIAHKGVTLFQALTENTKLVQSLTELQTNLSETLKMLHT